MHPSRGYRPSKAVGRLLQAFVALFAAFALSASPAVAAQAQSTVRLSSLGAKAKPTSLITFTGSAGRKANAKVTIERKSGRAWRSIAKGRTAARGRFSLTWITPSRASRITVRARLGSRSSKTRNVRVLAPVKGAKTVKVSPLTRIISPSVVESVPVPGAPGAVTYAGGNDAKAGQIVVIGQGEATPDGFLGKVTDVDRKNGETVVSTVPATLLDAVPEGSFDLVAQSVTATRSQARRASTVTCVGAVGASITHDVQFTAGLTFKSDWTFLGGMQSASLTANAGVDATVKAAITAAGSCALAKTSLLRIKGPSVSGFVGPVPIVMTSNLTVYLDASASAQATLSTGANVGFSASAGIGWTKAKGFEAIQNFTPKFGFDPPTLSAGASAAINVTPTVDVLLYGLAGPQVALRTGVEFQADTTQNPWWTLGVPVDLTASLTIAPLKLSSPQLHVYQQTFPLVDAGRPFPAPAEPGAPAPAPDAPPAAPAPTPSTTVAAGYAHSCALRSGAVRCWGGNSRGQLGTGNKTSTNKPVAVLGVTGATSVVAGREFSCALRAAGDVVCWGENGRGQLGNGNAADQPTPIVVSGITNAIAIAAGDNHVCAVLNTGRVKCWGGNDGGQLGNGSLAGSSTPVDVSGLGDAVSVAAATAHTCAVLASGSVRCWGKNAAGELGNGTEVSSRFPVPVKNISDARAIKAGISHTCALLATGGVSCWGEGGLGQLGNNGRGNAATPVAVNGITDAVAIGAGGAHACAVTSGGTVKCWGWANYGQTGDGGNTDGERTRARLVPVAVLGVSGATEVAGGLEHSCTLLATGGLKCWGFGTDGELGNGASTTTSTPVNVVGLP